MYDTGHPMDFLSTNFTKIMSATFVSVSNKQFNEILFLAINIELITGSRNFNLLNNNS